MSFLQRLSFAMKRQINVILAVATYENHRKASGSSLGNWESILTPLQIMLFFVAMRLGFSFVRGSNRLAAGGSTDMYFNIIIFIASGFAIAFLFRQIAVKALSGLKLRSPLYYKRIEPIDILLALSLNDVRAFSTISLALMGLVWAFTWSFQMDSPGLAICIYLLVVNMAIGFGICLVFLGRLNKFLTKLLKRIIQRLIIFTSGLFFATFELPEYARPFVTWNPVLHGV